MPPAPLPALSLGAAQARLLHVAAQGLLHKPRARATPAALEAVIARMQLLQIDTIHVVARSPYLVLFSRLGAYPQAWLEALLEHGRIAECWAHEACFVPAVDYPMHAALRLLRQKHWAHARAQRMLAEQGEAMDRLLAHVRTSGPVRSSDFSGTTQGAPGWWQWKPEKRWLEAWFALGDLMVARRERFQRVYDLAARVQALHPAMAPVTADAARRWAIAQSVKALGVTQARWIADYFRLGRVEHRELQPLLECGELLTVSVDGWETPGYVHRDHLALLRRAAAGRLRASHSTLLSPFDPLVWDRSRTQAMFGFAYTLECYVPAAKRRFGYFVLPILHHGRLVGRLDAKAHRARGEFEVRSLFLEEGQPVTAALLAGLAEALHRCAAWHATPRVRIGRSEPRSLAAALRKVLRSAG
jgi:uncharacterized protein YcaQ